MSDLALGVYGIYLLLAGLAGNGAQVIEAVKSDTPGFLPWGVSLAILGLMYQTDSTRPVAKPFLGLLILTFFLRNWSRMRDQATQLYSMANNAAKGPTE